MFRCVCGARPFRGEFALSRAKSTMSSSASISNATEINTTILRNILHWWCCASSWQVPRPLAIITIEEQHRPILATVRPRLFHTPRPGAAAPYPHSTGWFSSPLQRGGSLPPSKRGGFALLRTYLIYVLYRTPWPHMWPCGCAGRGSAFRL